MHGIEKEIILLLRTGNEGSATEFIERLKNVSPDFVTTLRLMGYESMADKLRLKMRVELNRIRPADKF